MPRSRLDTALDEGLALPDGDVAVLMPPALMDLAGLDPARVVVGHTFRPDFDAWAGAGFRVAEGTGVAAPAALVCVPRSKALARHLIHQASLGAGLIVVDGQRDEGVDSLWKEVRARVSDVRGLTQGHGRLFWFESPGPQAFADWAIPGPRPGPEGLMAQPGVFSADGVDPASAALATALPERLLGRMADFGAGVGVLSLAVLARAGVASVDLIEAEARALDCARLNVTDPRARFHWADATQGTFGPFDGVVMNPPFHASRASDPGLGRAFIAAAARALTPQGSLWMVANRHLPYEAALAEAFREVETLGGEGGFKLVRASHPKGVAKGGRPLVKGAPRAPSRGAARSAGRAVVRDRRAR